LIRGCMFRQPDFLLCESVLILSSSTCLEFSPLCFNQSIGSEVRVRVRNQNASTAQQWSVCEDSRAVKARLGLENDFKIKEIWIWQRSFGPLALSLSLETDGGKHGNVNEAVGSLMGDRVVTVVSHVGTVFSVAANHGGIGEELSFSFRFPSQETFQHVCRLKLP